VKTATQIDSITFHTESYLPQQNAGTLSIKNATLLIMISTNTRAAHSHAE
jgi:hypothetical protein